MTLGLSLRARCYLVFGAMKWQMRGTRNYERSMKMIGKARTMEMILFEDAVVASHRMCSYNKVGEKSKLSAGVNFSMGDFDCKACL